MSGCFDRLELPEWWAEVSKRNIVASVLAGFFFAAGWWLIIDVAAIYPKEEDFPHAAHTCGAIATLAFIMINSVSTSLVRDDYSTGGVCGGKAAAVWLFCGFLLAFGSLIAALWIMFSEFIIDSKRSLYPGVALFLQNFFIFIGNIIFKFGRKEEESF